jgi:tetratricopeptide (TPR) repeat protein
MDNSIELPAGVSKGAQDAAFFNCRGIERFCAGDHEGALGDFCLAIRHDPGCAEAWNNSGLVRQLLGRLAQAIADLTQALALKPNYADALSNRGRAYQAQGDLAAARADFDRALDCAPGRCAAPVLHNRGALRQASGDLEGALADFDRALEVDPEHAATYVLRGTARKEAGDLEGALADFDRALERVPSVEAASIWHHRGGVRVLQQDFVGAIGDYDRALALAPEFFLAYVSRGHARYHRRDPRAVADYRIAFRLDPEGTAGEVFRLLVEQARQAPAEVLANCDQHLRISARDALAYGRRGLTLLLLGRESEAAPDLARFGEMASDLRGLFKRLLELARAGGHSPTPAPATNQTAAWQVFKQPDELFFSDNLQPALHAIAARWKG